MKHSATPSTIPVEAISGLSTLMGSVKQALLRPAKACAYIGVSRSELHRLSESDPTFPRKIVLGPRCVGFRTVALDQWLAAKEAA